jgi:hypothetical protein
MEASMELADSLELRIIPESQIKEAVTQAMTGQAVFVERLCAECGCTMYGLPLVRAQWRDFCEPCELLTVR